MGDVQPHATPDTRWPRRLSVAVAMLVTLYALLVVVKIAREPRDFHVNFKIYYYAATALSQGQDPYDQDVLAGLAGGQYVLPYGYPPAPLHLFRPLALLDYATASAIFVIVKFAAFAFLMWLWQRVFLERSWDGPFFLLCLFGFNYTVYFDLQTGNISIFEQVLLWLGFYAYLREKYFPFVVCVVLAASFKITPVFFLVLLLFIEGRKKWYWAGAGAALFLLTLGLSWLLHADIVHGFFDNIDKMKGIVNVDQQAEIKDDWLVPATWPLLKALSGSVSGKVGVNLPSFVPLAVFAGICCAVLGVTTHAFLNKAPDDPRERRVFLIMFACIVYLLVTPRLMTYSYVLALAPAYYIVIRAGKIEGIAVLLALAAISTTSARPPGLKLLLEHNAAGYPLFLTYAIWLLALWYLYTDKWTPSHLPAPPPDR